MPQRGWFLAGLCLTILTGSYNLGIIAIDDYNHGFALMIPAQRALDWGSLFGGIHPYLPKLLLAGTTRSLLALGVTDPFWQVRLALALIGVLSFCVNAWAARLLFGSKGSLYNMALFLLGFHFAMPLVSTRPMIETLCMPWLTLSAAFTACYGASGSLRSLAAAVGFLTLASLMRYQAGVCFVPLLFLVVYRRSATEGLAFLGFAFLFFVLSGLPDVFLSGTFHGQMRSYLEYNLRFSGEHFGRMPVYTFAVLALALTLPPTFFAPYRGFHWRAAYRPLTAPLLFTLIFLIAHSASAHKEDRFFIPILPCFLFCLVPLARFLWEEGARWRRGWFLTLNGLLLLLACTNIAQKNVLSLAHWLDAHEEIQQVDSVDGALVFFPQAFVRHALEWSQRLGTQTPPLECKRFIVLRQDQLRPPWLSAYKAIERFEPGWAERFLIWVNPKNKRRGPLVGYLPKQCP